MGIYKKDIKDGQVAECLYFDAALPVEQVCAYIAEKLKENTNLSFDEHTALYVATNDAGIASSVVFWKEAITHGPALLGPRLFPWTLANGVASCLSRTLGIQGPNITLVGEQAVFTQLKAMAMDDLNAGRIKAALVLWVGLERGVCLWC